MLSIGEYKAFIDAIAVAMFNKQITVEEWSILANRHACVKQSIALGVSPRIALGINEYNASVYNKLYVDVLRMRIAPNPDNLLQEALKVTNSLQYQLVMFRNFIVNDAIRLCPDLTESSLASYHAISILPNLPIEYASRFNNESQITILKNILYTKTSISEEDINIALRFNKDYLYLFELLFEVNDEDEGSEYLDLIKQTLTFRSEQIAILKLMIYESTGEKDSIKAILDIIKMLHPDNDIMQSAINGIAESGNDEIDKSNDIYSDIMKDITDAGDDLWDVLVHYGFVQSLVGQDGRDYIIIASDLIEVNQGLDLIGKNNQTEGGYS